MDNPVVVREPGEIAERTAVDHLLRRIRPQWQAKNLINRVGLLLPVDASSACQRLLNAAIHDLREKICTAGLDVAEQAASQHKLPPVKTVEEVDDLSTANVINLAYRMGLLTRPEWRRLSRCYEIRRDLEHEDDEYEAAFEDVVYIFTTAIEVVLARDPIELLRIEEIKDVVEKPTAVYPSVQLLADYEGAPAPRQEEILKFLVSHSLNEEQPEVIRQNTFVLLGRLEGLTQQSVKLNLVSFFQERFGRRVLTNELARVAVAAGVFPYLKAATRADYFGRFVAAMDRVGTNWAGHEKHGGLLRKFAEVGGLLYCPPPAKQKILKFLVLTYIGTPGGRTRFGNIRNVFYSDSAAPLIRTLIREAGPHVLENLRAIGNDPEVGVRCKNEHIAARFDALLRLAEGEQEAA